MRTRVDSVFLSEISRAVNSIIGTVENLNMSMVELRHSFCGGPDEYEAMKSAFENAGCMVRMESKNNDVYVITASYCTHDPGKNV